MDKEGEQKLLSEINDLKIRLEEAEQLIEAIKCGEVDAFAMNQGDRAEIYTLQSGDYAYRVLVENFSEGALNLTEDGLIVYTNNYFHELLKVSYEKVIGNTIFKFIHAESAENFKQLFKEGVNGKSKGEINLVSKGEIIPVYISLTSLYPKLATVGMIITDLSEKKKHEQQLSEKNIELEKSNAELASFSYIASHDLQEPLRKIRTFANMILERDGAAFSDSGKVMFGRMENAAKRMQALINDLLSYSRLSTNEIEFEKIYLGKIIDEVKQDLQEELKEKNAVVEVAEMPEVSVIPFQFRQLVYNIISNSLKFSTLLIQPVISITSKIIASSVAGEYELPENKSYCLLSIKDNGIGFESKYNEKIFELFQRLNGKEDYKGTGIGLSIVKKIVDNHKGIITASGELNKGATFNVYLPIN